MGFLYSMIIDVLLSFVGSKFYVHCTINHRLIDGVDAWYTSSTTTNECEVHLYHLIGCPIASLSNGPTTAQMAHRPNRLAQTFLGRPKMAHWANAVAHMR